MKIYLNTLIVLLMDTFNLSSYAEAAGLYSIITQAEQDGLFQVLDYNGRTMLLGEEYERRGIDVQKMVEYIHDINKNPMDILAILKAGDGHDPHV